MSAIGLPPLGQQVQPQPQLPQAPMQASTNLGALMQPQAAPPATPEAHQALKSTWIEALSRPEVQAGLMQFAMAAFQPPSPGQSSLGHVANAVSKGGQAIERLQTREQIDAERAAKLELEGRRVGAVEAGAASEKERVGIERTRAAEDVRSNQARELLTHESEASRERQHQATLAQEVKLARERITAEAGIAAGSRDDRLLGAILEDETSKYNSTLRDNTQQRMSINSNPMLPAETKAAQLKALQDPKPPSMQDLMSRFKVLRGVVNNKGQLADDNTVSDHELVTALTSKDPSAQARAQALLPYASQAQQTRVQNLIRQRTKTQQAPATVAK